MEAPAVADSAQKWRELLGREAKQKLDGTRLDLSLCRNFSIRPDAPLSSAVPRGLPAIARLLEHDDFLEKLDLQRKIFSLLFVRASLTFSFAAVNELTDDEVAPLIDALAINTTLKRLVLYSMSWFVVSVCDDADVSIASALPDNKLGPPTVDRLSAMLARNRSLSWLGLGTLSSAVCSSTKLPGGCGLSLT